MTVESNVNVAISDGKLKLVASKIIQSGSELLVCHSKKSDAYFLVNYGESSGNKNLNCIELTVKQILEILSDKVNL